MHVRQVAPGVFAALAPPPLRFADANATVIVTEREAIVVDVPGRADRAVELLDRIAERTDKPVRYLVLTHWHGDHSQLAGLLRQRHHELEVIAHPSLMRALPARTAQARAVEAEELATAVGKAARRHRSGLSEQGKPLTAEESEELAAALRRARERLRILRETEIVRPSLLVSDELVLRRGKREIRILHLPGHTDGDLVVFLPQDRVAITGDLLDAIPFAGDGDLTRWIASLDALERLDFDIVVPGRGELLHGKEHLRRVRDFLRSIRDQVDRLVAAGVELEEARERVDVERFRGPLAGDENLPNRAFDHFRDAAVERAWELAQDPTRDMSRAAVGGGLEVERQRLLELHERQRTAHLEKDADLLVSMLADDFVSIENGVIDRPGREALRRRFKRYFAAVEFLEWSDLAPPEITLSEDGTLATVAVRKRVRSRPAAKPDAPVEETRFAWLETWRKRRGRWELIALASTQHEYRHTPPRP